MRRRAAPPSWLDNPLLPLYAWLSVVGIRAATEGDAPRALEVTAPLWLTYSWSGVIAAAGALTLAGCVTDRNRLEAAGLALLQLGLGLYALAETAAQALDAGDVLLIATLAGCAWLRLRLLRKARKAIKRARFGLHPGGESP